LLLETLEDRRMLSGVTLVTHGFQPSMAYPAWVDSMAQEIANRIADNYDDYDQSDVAQYHIEIADLPLPTNTIWHKSGSATFDTASTGEAVATVDWSDVSGVTPIHPTGLVADVLVNALVSTYPGIGISSALAEVPIHLIGHSRGASVVGALAEDLGERGIWVDQVTYLDTCPIPAIDWGEFDGDFPVTENVVFADSYWRDEASGLDGPNGKQVSGAFEHDASPQRDFPLDNGVFEGVGYGPPSDQHSDVHLWYHGTIDIEDAISDGDHLLTESQLEPWYKTSAPESMPGPRSETGYYYSRIGKGERPSSGLKFEGAHREPVSLTVSGSNVWDNVEILGFVDDQSVVQGNDIGVSVRYEDGKWIGDWDATVTVGYDTDTNPYNVNSVAGVDQHAEDTAWHANPMYFELGTGGLTPNTDYYVYAQISNGTHTRYYYAPGKVTIEDPTPQESRDFSILDLSWEDQDGDGVVEVKEDVELEIKLMSTADVSYIEGTLSCPDAQMTFPQTAASEWPDISAGAAEWSIRDYELHLNRDETLSKRFDLHLTYKKGDYSFYQDLVFYKEFRAKVVPAFKVVGQTITEIPTHNPTDPTDEWYNNRVNDNFESSEKINVQPEIKNIGPVPAHDIRVAVTYDGQEIRAPGPDRDRNYPDLEPGESALPVPGPNDYFRIDSTDWSFAGQVLLDVEITWGDPQQTVTLEDAISLVVHPAPVLSVSPREYDFGRTAPGVNVTYPMHVENRGSGLMTVTDVQTSNAADTGVADSDKSFTLLPGTSRDIPVTILTGQIADGSDITRVVDVSSVPDIRLFEPPDNPPPADQLLLRGLVENSPPTLTEIETLVGALADQDLTITYPMLAAAANEADLDPQNISFRIESISSGTLDVGVGTLLEPGGSMVWHSDAGANGIVDAFAVKAWDGLAASADPVQVQVQVVTAGVLVSESDGSTNVSEGGGIDTYEVALISQPSGAVTINLNSINGQVTAVDDANPANDFVVFTMSNWSAPQTVRVTAVDDDVVEDTPHAGTIAHGASSTDARYNGIDIDNVTASIADDDTTGITVNPTSGLSTTEAGGTATFTVVLDSEPTANVTIGLSSSDTTEGTVLPTSLTFQPSNWDTPKTVTVTGVNDDLDDGDIAYTIVTAEASSSDAEAPGII